MKPRVLLESLRAARGRQLRARATRPLRRRLFPRPRRAGSLRPLAEAAALWRSQSFEPPDHVEASTASRLQEFEQHYGEDVLDAARRGEAQLASRLVDEWIGAQPPRRGDAWHPYPLATRIGNWVAAATLEPGLATQRFRDALLRQARYLARNVEDDILGNHLIRDARGLVLAGAALGEPALLDRGVGLLRRELAEQVLPDGGHYERSPAYHLVVLRDLLEIRAVAGAAWLDDTIERMRRFSAALARPDGAPALFNDGSLDLAPRLELPAPPEGVAVFPDTGYVVVRDGGMWLAFDCGPPSPRFLPAHAHADALSFQLWHDGRPLVVDPGTYTYEPGADRDWFRSTRAHSTVSIDGRDQFELWGAFRAGRFPEIALERVDHGGLAGRIRWRHGPHHVRRIAWHPRELRVHDRIEGEGMHDVVSSLPLASRAVEVRAEGPLAVASAEGRLSERFGEQRAIPVLSASGRARLPLDLRWTIRLAG